MGSELRVQVGEIDLATPYVLVRTAILDRNLGLMQDFCDSRSVALRPHAKTHKMPEIAQRQIDLGSVGLTVATLGEAEVFRDAGFGDLFVACPVWVTADAAARLQSLVATTHLSIAVDSASGLNRLTEIAAGIEGDLRIRVEVDSGLRRTGVTPVAAAELGRDAARAGFVVEGVFTYPGHGYAPGAGSQAAADEAAALAAATREFARLGLECPVRSGASTPTARHTHSDVITEIRPGVYAFNDAQQVALGTATIEDVALSVVTTVISAPTSDRFVLDAGSKTIASDRPPYTDSFGLLPSVPGARLERLWEHHAVVDASGVGHADLPRIGQRLELIPNHVCTVVNLADAVVVMVDGSIESWLVRARGRNT